MTMLRTTLARTCLVGIVLAVTVAAGGWAATLKPTNEGFDLMQQITFQQAKANILIVLDVSGSMAWDYRGNDLNIYNPATPDILNIVWNGADSTGTQPRSAPAYYDGNPRMSWVGAPDPNTCATPTPTATPTTTATPTSTVTPPFAP